MTRFTKGQKVTIDGGSSDPCEVVVPEADSGGQIIVRDPEGYFWWPKEKVCHPVPDPPPVDPSKVTVDREYLRLLFEEQLIALNTAEHATARKALDVALDAALGAVPPDPTSDERCGAQRPVPPDRDEGFWVCDRRAGHEGDCSDGRHDWNYGSPVAAEAAPPKPERWGVRWPDGNWSTAATEDGAKKLMQRPGDGTVVPLWVVGEGQAIVNTEAFEANLRRYGFAMSSQAGVDARKALWAATVDAPASEGKAE